MVNASSGFSGFQLRLRQSPCIILPIVLNVFDDDLKDTSEALCVKAVISELKTDVNEV